MEIHTEYLSFSTQGKTDIIDLTDKVAKALNQTGLSEGQLTVFAIGSTTGITTVEYEPGLVNHDIAKMFDKIAPYGQGYAHNKTWGDDNGAAHLRSTLTKTSQTFPFEEGRLILGTWQQIIFIDFDTRPRSRKVVVQMLGNP